jgi:peptidoglycan/LPS O-acetylase OafA/YrhL
VAALFVLGPEEWRRAANEGIASVLYVSNLVFGYQATNYFAASVDSSLFLHTWSLGVEEQFYLVWPVLLLVLGWLARRWRSSSQAFVAGALVIIGVISFGLAVALTARGTPWSFFSLPTRAWEFAAGGLLVCLARARRPVPATAHWLIGLAGLVVLAVATWRLSDITPYPGTATLLPVIATMALIFSGDGRGASPVASALSIRPAQWLGRVSYAWYLWHWPVMLLTVAWLDNDTVGNRTAGVVVALGIAWVARRLVENPIRFSARLAGRPSRTFAVGATITLVVLVIAGGVRLDAQRKLSDPFYARLTAAETTDAEFNADASCARQLSPSGVGYCTYGDPNGQPTVLLTGDSHATHWVPAFDKAAADLGIRLIVHTRGACPSVPVSVSATTTRLVESANCVAFRKDTDTLIREMQPSAVVLANADLVGRILQDGNLPDEATQRQLWGAALGTAVDDFHRDGRQVGVVLETPIMPTDPNICMSRKESVDACLPTRAVALKDVAPFNDVQRATLAAHGNVPTLDITPSLCDADHCQLEHDGQLVYRDSGHLASGFVLTEVPAVETFLRSVVAAPS